MSIKKEELVKIIKGRNIPWFSPRRIARSRGMRTTELSPLLRQLKNEGFVKKVSRTTWVVVEWPDKPKRRRGIRDEIRWRIRRIRRLLVGKKP